MSNDKVSGNVVVLPNKLKVGQTLSSFSQWTDKCASSIFTNNPVTPFDMVGDEFRNDIKNNGGAKAGEIYKQKALETAKGEIALFDENKDGAISREEQVNGDKAAYEKKFGKLAPEDAKKRTRNVT
ncbi:MAG: hypothetical protein WCG95_02480 [bacterium]